jgi:hypothetical protein
MRMGSPQYGQPILDGEPVSGALEIEAGSLVWSRDGGRLAAQELVSWSDAPVTRIVVFDVERRTRIAAFLQDEALRTQLASSRRG